jgi:hypothetical protein
LWEINFILFWTNKNKWIIVESKMNVGQIQLGVKRSSGKSLDRHSTQGFFYAGGGIGRRLGARKVLLLEVGGQVLWLGAHSFLLQGRLTDRVGQQYVPTNKLRRFTTDDRSLLTKRYEVKEQEVGLRLTMQGANPCLATPNFIFYNNPSSKRVGTIQ